MNVFNKSLYIQFTLSQNQVYCSFKINFCRRRIRHTDWLLFLSCSCFIDKLEKFNIVSFLKTNSWDQSHRPLIRAPTKAKEKLCMDAGENSNMRPWKKHTLRSQPHSIPLKETHSKDQSNLTLASMLQSYYGSPYFSKLILIPNMH